LPEVRRLCLIGTIRYPNPLLVDGDSFDEENIPPAVPFRDDREVLSIMMENVRSSPYISKEQFQQVVLEVLNKDQKLVESGASDLIAASIIDEIWEELLAILGNIDEMEEDEEVLLASTAAGVPAGGASSASSARANNNEASSSVRRLDDFKSMVILVLSTSRKIKSSQVTDRRDLTRSIHASRSIQELVTNIVSFLSNTTTTINMFDNVQQREATKDLIYDGRFDNLLLPEHFDCDELPRRIASAGNLHDHQSFSLDDCVICLSPIDISNMVTLDCGHKFNAECIRAWMEHSNLCPTCRSPIVRTNPQDLLLTAPGAGTSIGDQHTDANNNNPNSGSESAGNTWTGNLCQLIIGLILLGLMVFVLYIFLMLLMFSFTWGGGGFPWVLGLLLIIIFGILIALFRSFLKGGCRA